MINAPIFEVLFQDPTVLKLLGPKILRFYSFDNKPEEVVPPYGTFQNYGGAPEQYLGTLPDVDTWSFQVDIYAKTAAEVRTIATAIRDAIEPHCYITRWGVQVIDDDKKYFRYSFDVDWMTLR